MDYTGIVFSVPSREDYRCDLFIDALAGIGFDTFEDTGQGFNAYIAAPSFDREAFNALTEEYRNAGLDFTFGITTIPAQNWNAVWESNFEPLLVSGKCYVRATFHEPQPAYPYEIVIDPKMAFGTGHHDTTALMIGYLLEEDLNGKRVLDMGCGTAILAILAAKAGATHVVAIDNDPVCFESSLENCRLNSTPLIHCICGSDENIPRESYDLVVANINRNILLAQLPAYSGVLPAGGKLMLSGFYEADLEMLVPAAAAAGFNLLDHRMSGDWVAARFAKRS
jgi:ribosomal protein L11 methyltransferase